MKHFVISGNYYQFKEFVNKKISSTHGTGLRFTDFLYVTGSETFRGHSDPHGWLIGTWKERPDIKEILSVLVSQYYNELIPQSVMEAWNEIKEYENQTP